MHWSEITPEEAEHYLAPAKPTWRSFWFHMHLMANDLRQLADGLASVSDGIYAYHAGHEGALARWVREVCGDGALAIALERAKSRVEAVEIIKSRVAALEAALKK